MAWKKLLVALDGSPFSENAARLALLLASRLDASVAGVHVVDTAMMDATFIADLSGSVGFQPFLNLTGEMREALRSIGETIVADFRSKLESAGVRGDARSEEGIVVNELIRASRAADALFLGAQGVGSKRGRPLGGHADALLRKLPIPAIVCPAEGGGFSRPLAAYDGSERSMRALAAAADIARAAGGTLEILAVEEDPGKTEGLRKTATEIAAAAHVTPAFKVARGHPDEEILRELSGHDCVALGSHGHGRIVEMVLGSTTERVLRRSPVPVLCAP